MKNIDRIFLRILGAICYLIGMVSVCLLVMVPLFVDIKIDQTLYLIGAISIIGLAHKLFAKIFLNLNWVEEDW